MALFCCEDLSCLDFIHPIVPCCFMLWIVFSSVLALRRCWRGLSSRLYIQYVRLYLLAYWATLAFLGFIDSLYSLDILLWKRKGEGVVRRWKFGAD